MRIYKGVCVCNVELSQPWQSTVMLLLSSTSSMIMKDVGVLGAWKLEHVSQYFFLDVQSNQVHI